MKLDLLNVICIKQRNLAEKSVILLRESEILIIKVYDYSGWKTRHSHEILRCEQALWLYFHMRRESRSNDKLFNKFYCEC